MLSPVVAVTLAATLATVPSIASPLIVQLIRRCPSGARCAPPAVVLEMKRETERIWFSLGIQLFWIDSSSAASAERAVPDLVVMVEENPKPFVGGSVGHGLVLGSMYQPAAPCDAGVAHLWVTHVRRHIDSVYVHGVPLISVPTRSAQLMFARALGRALAHEVGHYLLGPAHASHGLMRATFSPQQLLEFPTVGTYDLDDESRTRLTVRRSERTALHCGIRDGTVRGASQP